MKIIRQKPAGMFLNKAKAEGSGLWRGNGLPDGKGGRRGGGSEIPNEGNQGKKWGLKVVVGLLGLALAGQFYWSNNLAVAGGELAKLRGESQRLEGENLELKSKIAEMEALERIERRAEELGMMRVTEVAKVKSLSPLAYSGEGEN